MRWIKRVWLRIWGTHGEWHHSMTTTRGPWPYSGRPKGEVTDSGLRSARAKADRAPERAPGYLDKARAFCAQFGHVLYHGWCSTCEEVVEHDPEEVTAP